ncbi:MAG: putative O-glycosylation ligase, exosortase A system-associated [Pseudomonadota bacterium]
MRDIIVFVGLLAFIPLAGIRPILCIYLWTWFAIMNPHREAYSFAQTLPYNKMIAAVSLVSIALSAQKKRLPGGILQWVLFAFFAWITLVTFRGTQFPDYSQEFYQSRILPVIVFLVLTLMVIDSRIRLHGLVWVYCIALGWHAVKLAIVTVASGGNIGSFLSFGPVGTMIEDRNHFALAILMIVPLCYYLYLQSAHRLARIAALIVAGCAVVSVLGTFSRGGLVGMVAMAGYMWLNTRHKIWTGLAAVLIGLGAIALMPGEYKERMLSIVQVLEPDEPWRESDPDASFQSRLSAWCMAYDVAKTHPVTGGGLRVVQHPEAPDLYGHPGCPLYGTVDWVNRAVHSIYFEVASDLGFVGLGLFLAMPLLLWWTTLRIEWRARGNPELAWAADLGRMLRVSIIAYFVSGGLLSMAYYDGYYTIVVMTICLWAVVRRQEESTITDEKNIRHGGWLNRAGWELPPGARPSAARSTSETSAP